MEKDIIKVTMLGKFAIEYNGRCIEDNANRSRSSQLLLAYMICHRDRAITQKELYSILWGDDEVPTNPLSAIKTLMHRTRAILNSLGDGVGYDLVIRKDGCYAWNTAIETVCDFEDFACLCSDGYECDEPEKCIEFFCSALELYRGDFLPKLSAERWAVPIGTYYHELFVTTTVKAAELLEKQGKLGEVIAICRRALTIEPRSDKLMSHLLYSLINTGDRDGAISQYESMSALLAAKYDTAPACEITELYNSAKFNISTRTLAADEIKGQLTENTVSAGPLKCGYEMFKVLYRAEARLVSRSKDIFHVALFTVSVSGSGESIDSAMGQLADIIQHNMRAGDIITKCSTSQYIILLPGADYDSSRSVCERLIGYFKKQCPDSGIRIDYDVWNLEPADRAGDRKRRSSRNSI